MWAYLNLGTNLGDKIQNIENAINAIEIALDGKSIRSSIIESEPWGFDSANMFLNIGIAIKTDLSPLELLKTIKEIEQQLGSGSHRNSNGDYADRLIDIDIMAMDDLEFKSELLTIPHPQLNNRVFFESPYNELKLKVKSIQED